VTQTEAFGKEKKLSQLLDLTLANSERLPVLEKLLSALSVLVHSTVHSERGFSVMNLVNNNFSSSMQES
jgi:hypothetical protein